MRVGLLVVSIGAFGQSGFYNLQEVGLAKALDKLFEEVVIYKLVARGQEAKCESLEGCHNTQFRTIPSYQIGSNGIPMLSALDPTLDVLVFCSDTQICVPQVYAWAFRNQIRLIPYIGVVESHSTSGLKRWIMDMLIKRNIAVYKKCSCIVKTPQVKQALERLDVRDVTVAPVGLDLSVLNTDYAQVDIGPLRKKYGYGLKDKILLYIGRLIQEKRPEHMIDLLSEIRKEDKNYKLLLVGSGEREKSVETRIAQYGLEESVQLVPRIPNKDIWELYRIADCFVNLNQQEIFGMAILEAMYYGCKVVAWKAPGPDFIIEHERSGFVVNSNKEAVSAICYGRICAATAHQRILDAFTWERTAKEVLQLSGKQDNTQS